MAKTETVKLTAPNGASVTVAADRVDSLLRSGFTEVKAPAKKATAKKASSSSKS